MNTRRFKARYLPWLLAGVAAAVLISLSGRQSEQQQAEALPAEFDYDFDRATFHRSDETGALTMQLTANRVRHLPEGDHLIFDQPELRTYSQGEAVWRGTAVQGESWAEAERIFLHDEVVLERKASDDRPPLMVFTRDVWLYPPRDLAETEAATRIEQGLHTMRGQGARVWLDTEVLELQAQVESVYVPK